MTKHIGAEWTDFWGKHIDLTQIIILGNRVNMEHKPRPPDIRRMMKDIGTKTTIPKEFMEKTAELGPEPPKHMEKKRNTGRIIETE